MAVLLDRVDSSPVLTGDKVSEENNLSNKFDTQFLQWIWVLVEFINQGFSDIETAFNFLSAPHFTQNEIIDIIDSDEVDNGVIVYDTTNNIYVGKINGSLVQFSTTSYP